MRATTQPTPDPGRERADAELLAALDPDDPQGARRALAELYARHGAAVLSFLERTLRDRSSAEDALQDVFLSVARHGREQRGSSVRAWMLRIAANRVRDERRSRDRRDRRERAAAREELHHQHAPTLLDEELETALSQLPANLRAALELRFAQDLTHAEVARTLGVSLRTAKSWSAQGLEVLRRRLDGDLR
ncbi:RNA polymerase sigma factor [Engelhardtia mirabilis]|uniref:RNA polymerase sigma factor n=1 Tax=Engelhardtia mirabilis TaxID=2528011 RepID=UPI003AF3FDE3